MPTTLRLEMIWPPNGAILGTGGDPVIFGRTFFEQSGLFQDFWVFERFEWNIRQVSTGTYWDPLVATFVPGVQWWPAGHGMDPGEAIDTPPDAAIDTLAGIYEFWLTTDGTVEQLDFAGFPDGDYVFTVEADMVKLPGHNRRRGDSATTRFTIDASRPTIIVKEPAGDIVDRVVTFSGLVSDDHVDTVSWAIRDRELGDHWHSGSGFRESLRHHPLTLVSGAWSFEWNGGWAGSGDYELIMVAEDDAANRTEFVKPFRTDFGPPVLRVHSPTAGAHDVGPMVRFSGVLQARNAGTAYVQMGITDLVTGEGWNFDRSIWGHPDSAYLLRTGKIWEGFDYTWDGLSAGALGGSGSYRAELTCNQSPLFPQASGNTVIIDFHVAGADFVFPRSTIDEPIDGASVANGVVTVSGTAADPAGIMSVRIKLERLSDGFTWGDEQTDEFTESTSRRVASIDPGGNWSLSYDLSGQTAGEYSFTATAVNTLHEREPTAQRPIVTFTLS